MTRCWLSETHVAITPEGKIKPCTRYKDVKNAPSINEHTLESVFFEEYLMEPRVRLQNDDFPKACSKCMNQENNGIQSMRQLFNMNSDFSSLNGSLEDIRSFEIAFSNHCNYRCRHCNSFSSAKWKNEDLLLGRPVPETMLLEPTVENLNINKLVNLSHIKILGGEPLLNKSHTQFMKEISKRDCSNITLEYFTNGSIFPDQEIVEIWSKFKGINLHVSLEDVGVYFNYFRTDGDFYGKVEPICAAFDGLRSHLNIQPYFHIVLNVLNLYRLDKVLNYIFEYFPEWKITVDTVENPHWLQIGQWSKDQAEYVVMFLTHMKSVTKLDHNKQMIDYMCRLILSKCTEDFNNFDELMKYNSILDKNRYTDISEVHHYISTMHFGKNY